MTEHFKRCAAVALLVALTGCSQLAPTDSPPAISPGWSADGGLVWLQESAREVIGWGARVAGLLAVAALVTTVAQRRRGQLSCSRDEFVARVVFLSVLTFLFALGGWPQ